MIFTFIVLISAILAIICHILDKHTNKDFDSACIMFAVAALLVGAGCFIAFACSHIGVNKRIEENQIEYQTLIKRVEIVNSDYEDVSKSDVIKDIGEWNIEVHDAKFWAENPWTNWLMNKRIVDSLEYIELE